MVGTTFAINVIPDPCIKFSNLSVELAIRIGVYFNANSGRLIVNLKLPIDMLYTS